MPPSESTAPVMLPTAPPDPSDLPSAQPQCVHFGTCGGCQYQNLSYPSQCQTKAQTLGNLLTSAGIALPTAEPQIVPCPDPYGYRNRIRLRVRPLDGQLRLGYSTRTTNDFLPITMCPIAAPLLWRAATTLLSTPSPDLHGWLASTAEAELFTNPDQTRLQLTLLCPNPKTPAPQTFLRAMDALSANLPELSGAGAHRLDRQSGRALDALATWGASGLVYPVPRNGQTETYWITRGAFFQVNRFLLPTLVHLVCANRTGSLAWDLFAGVGLFSRPLAAQFSAVTAVESNPTAAADLTRALAKLGPQHRAVPSTTIDFLRAAVLQRDRPDLVVLDPPRAGAGAEACQLLARIAPPQIVYLSCDPSTLARDLAVLTTGGYRLSTVYLIDLFPQTLHIETLVILDRL